VRPVAIAIVLCSLLAPAAAAAAAAPTAAADPIAAILARGNFDSWAAADLRRAFDGASSEARIAGLRAIGSARLGAAASEVARRLDDGDPAVSIAVIEVLSDLWPTSVADAERVRKAIGERDDRVSAAAIRFAIHVGDDRAIPELARRLEAHPGEAIARDALRRLSGQDLADGAAWSLWYQERVATGAALLDDLARDVSGTDAAVATRAVHRLITLKEQPSAVAELLITAADRPEPEVRAVAATGLRLVGGPVAACWKPKAPGEPESPATLAAAPAVATRAAAPAPASASGSASAFVPVSILIGALAAVAFAWRGRPAPHGPAPAPAPVPVVSTRIIRRRERMTWLR
jgi:hypothetical protein